MDENTNTDEERGSEAVVKGEDTAAPPKVITITPPSPFDDETLAPLVEVYMDKRGLSDKKQAAIKLAQTMFRLGIDPGKQVENVNSYVQSMSAMLDNIPDYPESEGVKGMIAGTTALEAGKKLRTTYFPTMGDEEQEMKALFRTAQRYKVLGKVLNDAFGGGNETESGEVKVLKSRLDALEKKKEMDEQLAPIKESISKLTDTVTKLIEGGGVKTGKSEELSTILDKLGGIEKRIGDLESRDKFTAEIGTVKEEVKKIVDEVKTLKVGGGAGDLKQLETVLTTTVNVLEKVQSLTSQGGVLLKKGEEGLDWKTVAISQSTEVVKEGIKAAKDIALGREQKEKEPSSTKNQGISEKVIDQVVMGYCMKEIGKGNFDINVEKAAAELELPPKQVADSIMRLKERGVFKTKGEEKKEEGAKSERREGEGTIKSASRSEAVIVP